MKSIRFELFGLGSDGRVAGTARSGAGAIHNGAGTGDAAARRLGFTISDAACAW